MDKQEAKWVCVGARPFPRPLAVRRLQSRQLSRKGEEEINIDTNLVSRPGRCVCVFARACEPQYLLWTPRELRVCLWQSRIYYLRLRDSGRPQS